MWHISEGEHFLKSCDWQQLSRSMKKGFDCWGTKESETQEDSSHLLITPGRRRGYHNTQQETQGDEQKHTEQAGGVFGQCCLTFCGDKQQTSDVSISLYTRDWNKHDGEG